MANEWNDGLNGENEEEQINIKEEDEERFEEDVEDDVKNKL